MTDVRAGDRVRVTREFVVSRVAGSLYEGGVEYSPAFYDVEILELAKPKVGDTVKPIDHPDLPNLTVLRHDQCGKSIIVKNDGKWYYPGDSQAFGDAAPSWDTFTLVYLPE